MRRVLVAFVVTALGVPALGACRHAERDALPSRPAATADPLGAVESSVAGVERDVASDADSDARADSATGR